MDDLAAALLRRDVTVVGQLPSGLSCTSLYDATAADGLRLVLKVLRGNRRVVDGHDAVTFRRKRRQIELLRDEYPQVAAHYVPIIDEFSGAGWQAHLMPYVDGSDLLSPACRAADRIGAVLDRLATVGYAPHARRHAGAYMRSAHLDRLIRRLPFLRAPMIPERALSGPGLQINGVACAPLDVLLGYLDGQLDRLEPPLLSPPIHGDLNTRNVIASGTGFALIDPRGVLEPVDVCYDLGKIMLSVSVWDPLIRRPGSLILDQSDDRFTLGIPAPPEYLPLLASLPAVFTASGDLAGLLATSADWQLRLAFTHAVHAIAEAACRVSDAQMKLLPARPAARLASAFLLFGLALLNDIVRCLRERSDFSLSEHLDLASAFVLAESCDVPVR